MATTQVKVPDIGDFKDVDVIEVLVSAGDTVSADDALITLESDKASMEIPSPQAGVVREVHIAVGDKVSEGALIATLEAAGAAAAPGAAERKSRVHEPAVATAVLQEIKVPDIGDFKGVDVIEVLVAPGDTVAADDPLITLESDKASMEVPSPAAGTVRELRLAVGAKVSEGDAILLLEVAGGAPATAPAAAVPAPAPAPSPAAAPASAPGAGTSFARLHASPSVRRMARERKIDLGLVQGTGRKGRVTREDLDRFARGEREATATPAAAAPGAGIPPMPPVDHAKFGAIEVVALNKIKRLTGINLARAWLNVPHVTHHDETDIGELEAFRAQLKPMAEKAGVRVTMLSFIIKACAAALQEFPSFNASLDPSGENLILKRYYNIGVAVDTPNGLVVPVIRDADKKGLFDLSRELAELSGKARDKKLKPGEMQGGTFTISSLGGIGGIAFTPIVNAPEVAILGLTRTQQRPFPKGDGFEFRPMLPMSLSYDHRVIDGAEAARFVRHLGMLVNDIRLLLI